MCVCVCVCVYKRIGFRGRSKGRKYFKMNKSTKTKLTNSEKEKGRSYFCLNTYKT